MVADNMPHSTVMPMDTREAAPAPEAVTNGTTPRINAKDVMMMGRRRSLAAPTAAVIASSPCSCFILANSTIKIAFLAARPISNTMPICA